MTIDRITTQMMARGLVLSILTLLVLRATPGLAGERYPQFLLRLPSSTDSLFVAETDTSTLYRLQSDDSGTRIVSEHYISIGQAGAGKQRSGDKKTPFGVYFITEALDTTRLHEKYGPKAFPLDYPNVWDRRRLRSGDGIWVHGVDRRGGKRPPLDTDGCIALPNADLVALSDVFKNHVTPVAVTNEIVWRESHDERSQQALESAVGTWLKGQQDNDLFAYLESYDDSFTRWGLSRKDWNALQAARFARDSDEVIESDPAEWLLLRYPQESGLYFSRIPLRITKNGTTQHRMKRLFWRQSANGHLLIVAEDEG